MTKEKKQHIELVDLIIENFPPPVIRWCIKFQQMTLIQNLKTEEYSCWKCNDHMLRNGICDPL